MKGREMRVFWVEVCVRREVSCEMGWNGLNVYLDSFCARRGWHVLACDFFLAARQLRQVRGLSTPEVILLWIEMQL